MKNLIKVGLRNLLFRIFAVQIFTKVFMQTPQKIAVVGSGLVGTLLAIYLKRAGHTVHVFDRSPDIRTVEFSGRSINLVMSNRGWKALEDVGLDEEIRKIGIPVDKRAIHLQDGKLNYQY